MLPKSLEQCPPHNEHSHICGMSDSLNAQLTVIIGWFHCETSRITKFTKYRLKFATWIHAFFLVIQRFLSSPAPPLTPGFVRHKQSAWKRRASKKTKVLWGWGDDAQGDRGLLPEEANVASVPRASYWVNEICGLSFGVSLLIPWLGKSKERNDQMRLFFQQKYPSHGGWKGKDVSKCVCFHSESWGEESSVLCCFIYFFFN